MSIFAKFKASWRRGFSHAGETLSEEYIGQNAPKRLRYGLYSVSYTHLTLPTSDLV